MDFCTHFGGDRLKNGKCSLTQNDITFEYDIDREGLEKGLFKSIPREISLPQSADIILINNHDIGYIDGVKEGDTTIIRQVPPNKFGGL